jgi:hypothetical protein
MSGLNSTPVGAHAALGGGDDGAAVARAQIDEIVGLCDLGHVEHAVDQGLGAGDPDHVLAGLAAVRFERLGELLRDGAAGHRHGEAGGKQQAGNFLERHVVSF